MSANTVIWQQFHCIKAGFKKLDRADLADILPARLVNRRLITRQKM